MIKKLLSYWILKPVTFSISAILYLNWERSVVRQACKGKAEALIAALEANQIKWLRSSNYKGSSATGLIRFWDDICGYEVKMGKAGNPLIDCSCGAYGLDKETARKIVGLVGQSFKRVMI